MSEAGNLAMGWTLGVIGDLVGEEGLFVDGDWVETKDQDPRGDVRLIQLADVGDGEFLNRSARFLTSKRAKELSATFLAAGDLLVARMPDPLGRAAIFPGDTKASITAVDVCIVRPAPGKVVTRWLMHAINSPQFRAKVAALQSGSTRKRISRGNLSTVQLAIPPCLEQKRIAEKCDELLPALNAGVVALERARANLRRYRAAVLKAAVEGRLTEKWRAAHPDIEPASKLLERILAERKKRWEEAQLKKYADKGRAPTKGWKEKYPEPARPNLAELPKLPEGWCWATIDQVSHEVRNGSARAPTAGATGYRILRINAVRAMSVDLDETRLVDLPESEAEEAKIRNGDLLFTRYNGSPDLVGVAGLVRNPEGLILHPDKLIRARLLGDKLFGDFLELACNVGLSREHIRSRTRTTAGQAGVSGSDIKQLPIPLPPKAEIVQVMNEANRSLSLIAAAERQTDLELERSPRLRQAILKRAFEGKLVPQDPKDEPASELLARIRAVRVGERKGRARRIGGAV